MTEQQLNTAQIGTGVKQVCGERVTQNMWAKWLAGVQLLAQLLADNPNRISLERFSGAFSSKEPVLGAPAPINAQDLQQLRRQHHLAWKLALALAMWMIIRLLSISVTLRSSPS